MDDAIGLISAINSNQIAIFCFGIMPIIENNFQNRSDIIKHNSTKTDEFRRFGRQ
jgi:hypothetical protein